MKTGSMPGSRLVEGLTPKLRTGFLEKPNSIRVKVQHNVQTEPSPLSTATAICSYRRSLQPCC